MNANSNPKSRRLGQRLFSNACALLTVSLLAALAVPSQSFALTLPPPIDLGDASVKAVAQGYVVGMSNSRAFVWSAATSTKVEIPTPADSPRSVATGVNSHGEVVGGYWASDWSSSTAFYWSQATGLVTICLGANFDQSPVFINESGVVAGTDNNGHVFRWTRTGVLQDLGGTGADAYSISVFGINARGDIIGSGGFVAWASESTLTILQSPGTSGPPNNVGDTINTGGNNVQINAINDSGVVVGTYWDFGYIYSGYDVSLGGFFNAGVQNSHAFKWTSTEGFTDLGNLGTWRLSGNPNPIFAARANAINNSGTIVGLSYLSAGNTYVPFVYNPGTGMTQLPKLNAGDDYALASGINDGGVVAGYSGGPQYSVLWESGVPTNITPSFAGVYTGSPLIKGSTVAGNGAHAWTFALPSAPPPPPAVLFFTDPLTGPTSPNLATFPAGKYGYTASGLQRTNSTGTTDRPIVTTALATYLTQANFTAEVTVKLANIDILYFGLGQGNADPSYFNEPANAFYFRVHSGWDGNTSIQADVRNAGSSTFVVTQVGTYSLGSTITLRIVRAGNNVTMSVVGGGSVTYSISASPSLGLTSSNTRVFLGNSTAGSVFSNLSIYETPPPPVNQPPVAKSKNVTVTAGANCLAVASINDGSFDPDAGDTITVTQTPGGPYPVGVTAVTLTVTDNHGASASNTATVTVLPGVTFSQPVPDVFPGIPFLTCVIGNFQEPTRIQNWKLLLRSSATETVVLTVAATTVNPLETGAIEATVTDQTGLKIVTVVHPATMTDNLGTLSLTLQGGQVYDLAIRRTGQAAHYKLGSPDKRLEIGFSTPLLYLEHHEQAWLVNAAPNENVNISVFSHPPAGNGAGPHASNLRYSVRRADCSVVVPSTTISVNGTIAFNAGTGGSFVIYFESMDGHFALQRNSGCDGGFYALPCPPKVQIACPTNIVRPNDPNQCGAIVNFTATATGVCAPTVTYSKAPGSFFPIGTTTVTATATDLFGETATCSFTVTVNDTQPPTLTVPGAITVNTAQGRCDAVVHFTATATDNCQGVTVVSTPASGSIFSKGTTTVTSVATDAAGNRTTKTFQVTVNDVEPPKIVTSASNKTVECDGGGNTAALNAWLAGNGGAVATDNCGSVTWSHNFIRLSDECGETGSATVTFTATDTSGNRSSTTATFTIVDTTAPVLTSNVRDILPKEAPITFTVSGQDLCGSVTISLSVTSYATNSAGKLVDKSGSTVIQIIGNQVKIVDAGGVGTIITITATGVDDCGNRTVKQFVVKVLRPANEGVGNGVDGNTPGHDNNGGNDDPQFSPGNPGAKNK